MAGSMSPDPGGNVAPFVELVVESPMRIVPVFVDQAMKITNLQAPEPASCIVVDAPTMSGRGVTVTVPDWARQATAQTNSNVKRRNNLIILFFPSLISLYDRFLDP